MKRLLFAQDVYLCPHESLFCQFSKPVCVCILVSKSGRLSISAWGSVGWRCDVGDAKAPFESFLDSVVFITITQLSGIDSINSRNDVMSQTCCQHTGIRSQLCVLETYSAAEKLK